MCYQKEILRKNRRTAAFYLVLGIFCAFLTNFQTHYFQTVIDGLSNRSITLGAILCYGGLLVISYLANYLGNYPEKKLEHGIYLDFKLLALEKISRIDYAVYQTLGTGQLIQRIENGAEAGRNILFHFWFSIIREQLPNMLFSVYFIWRISAPITYAVLLGYVLVFLVTNLLLKSLYRIKERILTNEEKLNHYLVRGFMEMPIFRLARQFPGEIRKAARAKEQIVTAKTKMTMIHEAFFTIFALLVAVLDVLILVYAWQTGELTIGSAVALLTLLNNAYTPIAIFNVLYVQYKLDKASFQRYKEFLSSREDEQLQTGKELPSCTGRIFIKNLSFSYGERTLFHDLNLEIQPGEKVAFVGESGSGKSTLLKLIAGLLKYSNGSIRIDNSELKEISLTGFYEKISYLSQDSTVFDGSLRENILFEKEASKEQLLHAIEQVELTSLFHAMEQGFDTPVGERGAVLSGGERQRTALCRLWFQQSGLTILDEATSALDNLTEKSVIDRVLALLHDKTVIAVTHKLDAVQSFDKIVVFREGSIVEEGSFAELMEQNGYFAQLYRVNQQKPA